MGTLVRAGLREGREEGGPPVIHFGLDQAKTADVEIRWPSGQTDTLKNLDANRFYVIQEGGKILKSDALQRTGGKQ